MAKPPTPPKTTPPPKKKKKKKKIKKKKKKQRSKGEDCGRSASDGPGFMKKYGGNFALG
jgi:hypothetical protein